MEETKEVVKKLQELVEKTNTMLVETELEGDDVNQSWFEYETCVVDFNEETRILFFEFETNQKKTGGFLTTIENIQRYTIYNENDTAARKKHFYMHVKGKKQDPLISNGMSKVFKDEMNLEKEFSVYYLYNANRESINIEDKSFLNDCYNYGLFSVHKFEIANLDIDHKVPQNRIELDSLREYPRENEGTLQALQNLIHNIRNAGYEVRTDDIPVTYARAYVPDWNLILSPNTQSITTILNTLAQKDNKLCIVDMEGSWENKTTVAYIIEKKKKFYELYSLYLDGKRKRLKNALTKTRRTY